MVTGDEQGHATDFQTLWKTLPLGKAPACVFRQEAGEGPASHIDTRSRFSSRPGAQPAPPTSELTKNMVAIWWLEHISSRKELGASGCTPGAGSAALSPPAAAAPAAGAGQAGGSRRGCSSSPAF